MNIAPKKLYRSHKNIQIAGVCGGIAEYFNIDAGLVRLAWALTTLCFGGGLILYIIAWIVIPQSPKKYNVRGFDEPIIINEA